MRVCLDIVLCHRQNYVLLEDYSNYKISEILSSHLQSVFFIADILSRNSENRFMSGLYLNDLAQKVYSYCGIAMHGLDSVNYKITGF